MGLNSYSKTIKRLPERALLLSLLFSPVLLAQGPKITIPEPKQITVKRGGMTDLKLTATLNEGFHANSHTPSDENLIPLKLTWEPGALTAKDVLYPKPKFEKYEFSEKPLSVVEGAFDLTTKFAAAASAPAGPSVVTGHLRYQACNNNSCFPPKTVEIKLPVLVQ